MSGFLRQSHRWVSIVFCAIVAAIFLVQGLGRTPAQWVYFVPLAPLAWLAISGLTMFFQPYRNRAR
jgi:hypothetical protein